MLTTKQKETLLTIQTRWNNKKRGTYINRQNAVCVSALEKLGLVDIYPYCMEYGRQAFPAGAE